MQQITPFLWFDHQAEEAVKYYTSIFKGSKIMHVARYPEGSPGQAGSVMTVEFELNGQKFIALNGGPGSNSTGDRLSTSARGRTIVRSMRPVQPCRRSFRKNSRVSKPAKAQFVSRPTILCLLRW